MRCWTPPSNRFSTRRAPEFNPQFSPMCARSRSRIGAPTRDPLCLGADRCNMRTRQLDAFCEQHRLGESFRRVVVGHYAPLAHRLLNVCRRGARVIGISGAQGTGKSTLADFLGLAFTAEAGWRVAVLSLDDFYLSRARREQLSRTVHPLLATRGPPGTHDPLRMRRHVQRLKDLGPGESLTLPRFDKARDNPADTATWPSVEGPVDAVIVEGWCLGIPAQNSSDLLEPVNELEARHDTDSRWRTHVNHCLAGGYARLFALLDCLVYLKAPSMDAVLRWRLEQEDKLAATTTPAAPGIMNAAQVADFIQYFERLTRAGIERLPAIADATLTLDDAHGVSETRYRC